MKLKGISKVLMAAVIACSSMAALTSAGFAADGETHITADFTGYEAGTKFNTPGAHTLGSWVINLASGDSAEVAVDPTTGKKALKMTKSNIAGDLGVGYNFGALSEGRVSIASKVRFEHHSKYIACLPMISTSRNQTIVRPMVYGDEAYYFDTTFASEKFIGTSYALRGYAQYETVLDFESFEVEINEYYNDAKMCSYKLQQSLRDVASTTFYISEAHNAPYIYYKGTAAATAENPDNNGIYWISEVSVNQTIPDEMTMSIVKSSVPSGTAGLPNDVRNINVEFDKDIYETTISDESVKIFKNNVQLGTDKYSVSATANKFNSIDIAFADDLEPSASYKIQPSGIESMLDVPCSNVIEFTTRAAIDYIYEDFSIYPEGTKFSGAGQHKLGNWVFDLTEGDSVEIAAEPVTGKKALKFVKGAAIGDLGLSYGFGAKSQGIVNVMANVRFDHHSKYFACLPMLLNSAGGVIVRPLMYGDNEYYWELPLNPENGYIGSNSATGKYATFKTDIDFTNSTVTASQYADGVKKCSRTRTVSGLSDIAKLSIYVSETNAVPYVYYKGTAAAEEGNLSNSGIYWLSDVKIDRPRTVKAENQAAQINEDKTSLIYTATLVNEIADGQEYTIVSAVKNADGKLLSCKLDSGVLSLNENCNVEITAQLPQDAASYEAILVNKLGELKPFGVKFYKPIN